jgi:hypothetical protein
MKNITFRSFASSLIFVCLLTSALCAQKMTAEELISKHLDSIGTVEKRAEIKNQLLLSDLEFSFKGSATPVKGRAIILSEGTKSLWGMNLTSNDYPQDRFGFDGKETRVGYSKPGVRSVLGGFILSYKELLNEGLLGGTLVSSWALLNAESKKPKLSFEGTKKIDGKETYVITYAPKNGSDLSIKMYFDQKTFRHVRSEYNRVIAARQGGLDTSANQSADRYRLVEDFSNFQTVSGLTIPKTYKILYSYAGTSLQQSQQFANRELEWTFNVTNISTNQPLESNSFDIDAK